jgi:PAS domain S-box-containing protein
MPFQSLVTHAAVSLVPPLKQMIKDSPQLAAATSRENAAVDERLLAAFEAVPDALYLFDSKRTLIQSNRAARSIQTEPKSLQGRRCCQMFWNVDKTRTCVVDRAFDTGDRIEVEIQNGAQPIFLTVQPLSAQGGAKATEALVIARDISDLREAEAEAIAQRSFMASVADLTPDEIYALDEKGRIIWMNERAETDDPFIAPGRLLIEFMAVDSHAVVQENFRRSLAGEETASEIRAVRSDGSIREVEAHTAPYWKDGEVVGVLAFLRDVTERKREQELLMQADKLRAVGELAAGVAHNLNNSLTVIQGRAQLLLMRASDESVAKSLKVITNAVEEGTKTLRRILEFARRESSAEFVPVDLSDLVTSSVEIARPKWQSKSSKSKIEVRIECPRPVYVLGDRAELREVVLNLIFNAVDALPNGGILEVGTRDGIESGCFWVADTGVGMPAETVDHIFEPFFTTKGKKGTGLGLSASHGIVARHKGEIMVVSEPGEGTRFEVRLPVCEPKFTSSQDARPA